MDIDTFILTMVTAVGFMVVGLAYIAAPDFMRYFFGRHADPKRAPDKVLRGQQIFGVVLIAVGIIILIYNFTHPENAIYIRSHYHYR